MILQTGVASLEYSLNISCVVEVGEEIVVEPLIAWTKRAVTNTESNLNNISVEAVRDGNVLTLPFNTINTFDAGVYTCNAIVVVGIGNITVSNSSMKDLRFQSKLYVF